MAARFDPDAVAAATFPVARRGYDPDEVRAYLRSLGDEVARLHRELEVVRAELASRPKEVAPLDVATVAAALGEEAARVLTTARDASAQIRAKSEEAAATLVDDANRDALRIREQADLESARLREQAVADAAAEVEAAKAQGREMVAEARAVRERMLADVQKRKEQARAQLEQLRLGHERVLGTFELAAEALATVTADLRALAPDVRRTASIDTGPLPTVPPARPTVAPAVRVSVPERTAVAPVGDRHDVEPDEIDVDEIEPVEAEPVEIEPVEIEPVEIEPVEAEPVEAEPVEIEPVADDDTADQGEDDEADDVPARPSVLVSSFSLGEMVPVAADPAPEARVRPVEAAAEPEPVEVASVGIEVASVVIEAADVEDVEPEAVEPEAVEPEAVEPEAVEPEPEFAVDAETEPEPAAAAEPEPAPAAEEPAHHPRPSTDDLFARIRAARAAVVHDVAAAPAPAPVAAPVAVTAASARAAVLVGPDPDTVQQVVAARAAALAPVEAAVARRMKRVLADEQNEVLDRLRRKNPVLTLDGLLGSEDEHAAPYQRVVREELRGALVAGARSLRPELDDDAALAAAGRDLVDRLAGEARDEIVALLRERLGRLLEHAGDASSVTDGVRTLYREFKTQRLDEIAGQLTLAAHGRAAFAVLDPGTPVCWVVDPGHPCPDGEDNALGGPTPAGEPFPTGHPCAPAYPGCRCALAPAAR